MQKAVPQGESRQNSTKGVRIAEGHRDIRLDGGKTRAEEGEAGVHLGVDILGAVRTRGIGWIRRESAGCLFAIVHTQARVFALVLVG